MKNRIWSVLYIIFVLTLMAILVIVCAYNYEQEITNQSMSDDVETETSNTETENTTKIEIETNREVDISQAIAPVSLGEFKLTAYCSCSKCCGKWALNRPVDKDGNEIVYGSIGVRLVAGVSIAVDPRVIPYESEVVINGHTYKAQDCGGAIKGNRIDIYFDDHQEALNFGVQYAEVFLVIN